MAHTLTRSHALVDLTVASTTNILIDDYITGGTSGAVGIVAQVIDATSLHVYEMSSTGFAPTENITTADSAITTSCTGRVAGSTVGLAANAALVEGTDATVTDIFRQIADISGIGGVTNPSSTQNFLGLDMVIYIGRRGQSAATYAITQGENVVLGTVSNTSALRLVGTSSYSSTLRMGLAKYLDDDLDNFPPLYVQDGSRIKFDCANYFSSANELYVGQYGVLYSYRSILEGIKTYNKIGFNFLGEVRLSDVQMIGFGVFGAASGTAQLYFYRLYIQESQYSWLLLAVVPVYTEEIYFQNCTGDVLYNWADKWEILIKGLFTYDDNGSLLSGGNNVIELGLAYSCLHAINSDIPPAQIGSFFGGTKEILKGNTFKLTVLDESGNPLENATVELRDENGLALFTRLTAVQDAALNATGTTLTVSPNNDEIDVGDIIRIGTEKVLVTAKPTGTTCTITRAQEGTDAHIHGNASYGYDFWLFKQENALTDSNGEINYDSTGDEWAVITDMTSQDINETVVEVSSGTFTLKIYKDGYETYQAPLEISGYEKIVLSIKLKHALSQGRDDMADSFK